jgi:hypothetical protein
MIGVRNMNQSALDSASFAPGFTAQNTVPNAVPGGNSEKFNANETPGNGNPNTFTSLYQQGKI